jgi:hypothetical protein
VSAPLTEDELRGIEARSAKAHSERAGETTRRLICDLRQARADLAHAERCNAEQGAETAREYLGRIRAESERDEMRAARDRLLAENDRLRAAIGAHRYRGFCPTEDHPTIRDADCAACRMMLETP